MFRVAVSVISWGRAESALRCVQSLLTEGRRIGDRSELTVWVADNGSAPPDRTILQSRLEGLPGVTLRRHEDNLGFAAGHNRNVAAILARSSPDFLWLLNDDCVVHAGCLDALLDCAIGTPEVGVWGATLLEADGRTIQCAGGCSYNSWLSSYRPLGAGQPVDKRAGMPAPAIGYVTGASLFLPVATVVSGLRPPPKVGMRERSQPFELLNESFFLYFEEIDLALRLRKGLLMGWCREALITHAGGASTGTGGGQRSALAEFHSTLSALKFTQLHFPKRLWFMMPARFLAKCLQLTLTGNIRLLGPVVAAYRAFLTWRGVAGR